ncbi:MULTISPECIES: Nif3-like dinuclear metal center hexameric protein [unclassified Moritella]|uniref:Nif3-like dinuclear metal center hexameric protein n=1 Tax=unclassified Moritella TaxID=2637987 RepID=UPI001BA53816|nr:MULTISPECIES: Nif3-like dinuclear metal center hexameric protein [unclassified Moritella]QUM84976.1 Nif3-like dinuclear metal center hexameric protein [Moritella sp. 28]QUM89208.1 Nif3-like dinuclear metal center hexameric protein [Moritella sp. 36]
MASLNNKKLENILTDFMQPHRVRDFTVNGMQVQGKDTVTKVITGVTASQALIDAAVEQQADAILVHHGYFWKNESPAITGIKYNRIKTLIKHDINLYAYHLPLDIHPELGNNVELAKLLGITVRRGLEPWDKASVALVGKFEDEISTEELTQRIETQLNRAPLVVDAGKPIKSVAWCTGGGQSYIELAIEQGIDAFISGEASEQTIHLAREAGISFFAAGHHATERYGVKALGEWLAEEKGLDVTFIDIDNPV